MPPMLDARLVARNHAVGKSEKHVCVLLESLMHRTYMIFISNRRQTMAKISPSQKRAMAQARARTRANIAALTLVAAIIATPYIVAIITQ